MRMLPGQAEDTEIFDTVFRRSYIVCRNLDAAEGGQIYTVF